MGQPDGLVEWLSAQLDEDEREATRQLTYIERHGTKVPDWEPTLVAIAKRTLAEVAAKRAILDEYEGWGRVSAYSHNPTRQGQAEIAMGVLATAFAHLATVYADREGYRAEWRPDGQ